MSRRIKTYPFNQKFNDELGIDADTVESLKLPGAYIDCLSLTTKQKEILTVKTKVYALEESKGIHLQLVEEDREGHETGDKSEEIVIDEIKFCDSIHKAVCDDVTVEEIPFIKKTIMSLIEDYAKNQISGDRWLCSVNYDGFGAIMTDDTIIGTVDRVTFEKESIVLDYCVGNFNLNNIINCSIVFKTGNKAFKLTDIKMKNVTSNNDYYCTYTIEDYKGELLSEFPLKDDIFDGFVSYSNKTAEQFVEQRTSLIDSEEDEQDNSYLDDIL